MSWEFELVAGPYGGTTEGPAWDGQALLFTDIPSSRIMRYDPDSGECTEWATGTENTNGLNFDSQGNLYGCSGGGRRILRFNADGSTTSLPHLLDGKAHNRPNDLAIDRKGRIWFTDRPDRFPRKSVNWTMPQYYASTRTGRRGRMEVAPDDFRYLGAQRDPVLAG